MSGPLPCDVCHEREGLFLLGNQHTGDQISMCPGDFAIFGVKFAVDALPRKELLALVGLDGDAGAGKPAKTGGKPPGGKSKGASATVKASQPKVAEALAPESAGAADVGAPSV